MIFSSAHAKKTDRFALDLLESLIGQNRDWVVDGATVAGTENPIQGSGALQGRHEETFLGG